MTQVRPHFQDTVDLEMLRSTVIECGQPAPLVGRKALLDEHLDHLFVEFSGQPLMAFYHAYLIVRLRRGQGDASAFKALWQSEGAFLCQTLTLRWLVSACDTIVDSDVFEPADRTLALSASLLMATVKLYETERRALQDAQPQRAYPPGVSDPLFDGMTTFCIGRGDLVMNVMSRCQTLADSAQVTGPLLREILRRVHGNDTVFSRLLRVHHADATRWWP